ncbi:hypothetical protein BH24ACT1_BH24ACT1_10400 [soil metagenome]
MRQGWRQARRRLLAAASLAVVVASGCEMKVDVGIDVGRDGSGEVAVAVDLDEEAANRLPDLAAQLRLDDLAAAGWDVEGPTATTGGSTLIVATKTFATPEDATQVLRDVSGPSGPLRGFEVVRRSSFLSTDYTFTGVVDLSAGVEGFVDEELRRSLEGSDLSLARADLEELTGAPLEETFRFQVRATLPGSLTVAGTGTEEGDTALWRPVVGERLTLAATSEAFHRQRLAWLGVSSAAMLALIVVLVGSRRRGQKL